jgi:isopentenyldiphosphate isomerase
MPAQDPNELFDLYDGEGNPLGRAKPRGEVHRDGDWHRSLHLWVLLTAGEDAPCVLFQRRSRAKETWPGAVDVAVAGHLTAGETVEDALREAEEEIGLVVRPEAVRRLGVRRSVNDKHPPVIDRELQQVYFTQSAVALTDLRPDPDEVAALLAVPLPAARALTLGEAQFVRAHELRAHHGGAVRDVDLAADALIPCADAYFGRAVDTIARIARGEAVAPWTLG